jgi:hypothetical protein
MTTRDTPEAALAAALVMPMVEEGFAVPAANRDEQWDAPVEEAKRIATKALAAMPGWTLVPDTFRTWATALDARQQYEAEIARLREALVQAHERMDVASQAVATPRPPCGAPRT